MYDLCQCALSVELFSEFIPELIFVKSESTLAWRVVSQILYKRFVAYLALFVESNH